MAAYTATRSLLSAMLVFTLLVSSVFVSGVFAQSSPAVGPSARPMKHGPTLHDQIPALGTAAMPGVEGKADVELGGTNEPAIAVNPHNDNNIAVAVGGFGLRVSTDKGGMFSAVTSAIVPATHTQCGDSALAFDSQARLFWTYLGCLSNAQGQRIGIDIFIAQVNPTTGAILAGYPVTVTATAGFPASAGNSNDKEWLAADRFSRSPFQDQLYVVWTRFAASGTVVHTTFSTDQGLTWSSALTLSAGGEAFVWPSHNAVAPNGDVYVAYHSQRFAGQNPDGTSGQVFVLRSTDGGATYPQKTIAYTPGNADITFNVQTVPQERALNGSISWTQGSAQPWVLPDPVKPNNVYVVAADDPTNTAHGDGFDDMDVFIVRSTDQGRHWETPVQVNDGPV
jgi:hypothetical protein